ncbi:PKD domain-containing protein [Symbiobacterium terraclitae]|uniref:PKD domain-containing protein n=1 Tax=Symbiobacterium terraclitae TaxID=557451 RepID=UPI0035B56271
MAVIEGPEVVLVNKNGEWSGSSSYSDSRITRYEWDMGDGSKPVRKATVKHKYKQPGTYTITLTVTDQDGNTDTTTLEVVVVEPPEAVINGPASVKQLHVASFDGSQSAGSRIVRYEWDMGDGRPALEGPSVEYMWPRTGTYTVRLTVTDEFGHTGTTTLKVKVTK